MIKPKNKKPLVAIIGRPNVGKSSMFNRIFGERRAIVDSTAGVTRDRFILPVHVPNDNLVFDIMDTGGIGIVDNHNLEDSVEYQIVTGLAASDLVLFVVDSRDGLTLLDEEVAAALRKSDVPVVMVANKCETREAQAAVCDFSALGFGEAIPMSAQEGSGFDELYRHLATMLPPAELVEEQEAINVAILGRRNTGKSSFVNALTGESRVIVSDVAGTTRDAVDISVDYKGTPITLVDTAGVHRRGKINSPIEFFSLTRSDQAIQRADVALLFLDMSQTVARMDKELARNIKDRYKAVIVVGTKHDLVPEFTIDKFRDVVEHKLPHLRGAPLAMMSNVTKKGIDRVMRDILAVHEEGKLQLGTGELNRAMQNVFDNMRIRGRGERPRFYYATQLNVNPPTFLLFVNKNRLFSKELLRSLQNEFRRQFKLQKVPVRFVLRERKRSVSKKG
ncbi:MAG: ribosome biogenesis GTPase Der [Planctomycetota bacterium]|nr:ribosome biogenesis GTPase Der [Planctomycetota bacterium]